MVIVKYNHTLTLDMLELKERMDDLYTIYGMTPRVMGEWLRLMGNMLRIYDTYVSILYKALKDITYDKKDRDNYMTLLNRLDGILDRELRSEEFAHLLADCLDAWFNIHSAIKNVYPIRSMDIIYEALLAEQFRYYINTLASILSLDHVPRDTSSYNVVYSKGKARLLHYTSSNRGYPLLIVYAMINRYHIMDISKEKSVVKRLMENGIDVYLLDWGHIEYEDLALEDYLHILDEAVDTIRRTSGKDRISMLGYCWGGILASIYASQHKDKLNSLVVMAAPIDFSKDDGILAVWARSIDARRLVREYNHMNGQVLDIAFLLRNPVRYTIMKYIHLYERIRDRAFVETFFAVERWLYNTPNVPGRLYEQIVEDLYKGNRLVKGMLKVDGRSVDLRSIDIPLLSIVAENDDLTAPASTLAINEYVASREKKIMRIPGGHVGLCISSVAHKQLWPKVASWIKDVTDGRESHAEGREEVME